MPYAPNSRWVVKLAHDSTVPVVVLVVAGCPFVFSTGHVREKSAGGSDWNTATSTLLAGALEIDEIDGGKVDPEKNEFTLGDIKARVTDVGGQVTAWVATEKSNTVTWQQKCTVYVGAGDDTEDAFQVFYVGYLEDITQPKGGGGYVLQILSFARRLKKRIMTNAGSVSIETSVKSVGTPADTKFTIKSDQPATNDHFNNYTADWTDGDNEGTDQVVSDYVGLTREITLAAAAPNNVSKKDRLRLYNLAALKGNPANIVVRVLVNDFATTGQIQTDYPLDTVTGTPTGLDFVLADLDETQIKAERDRWLSGMVFDLPWTASEEAKKSLEDQIFCVLSASLRISPAGLIQFVMNRPTVPSDPSFEIRDDDVDDVPPWGRSYREVINKVIVRGDWDPGSNSYQDLIELETPDSRYTIASTGVENTLEIDSRGLKTAENGVGIADAVARRVLARFGHGPPERIEVDGGWRLGLLAPAERVLVTLSALPDMFNGTLDKTAEPFEVTRARMKVAAGRSALELVAFYQSGRPFFMGGSDIRQLAFSAATDEQKQFGFFGDASNVMSDGTPGYRII